MTQDRRLERWPGYGEQTWQQRFNELDRLHDSFMRRSADAHIAALERQCEAAARIRVLEGERDQLFEALGLVLGADPGPKAAAAFKRAREVWQGLDTHVSPPDTDRGG